MCGEYFRAGCSPKIKEHFKVPVPGVVLSFLQIGQQAFSCPSGSLRAGVLRAPVPVLLP